MDFKTVFGDAKAGEIWDSAGRPDKSDVSKSNSGSARALDKLYGDSSVEELPLIASIVEGEQVKWREKYTGTYGDGDVLVRGFHPSFISGSVCQRAFYYNAVRERASSFPVKTLRIFDNGSNVHSRIQGYLYDRLKGTWKCRKCCAIHNQQTDHYAILVEEVRKGGMNDDYVQELDETVSYSFIPEFHPSECLRCKVKNEDVYFLFTYKEWRLPKNKYGIVGKGDGLIDPKYGYGDNICSDNPDLVPIEIKSMNKRLFGQLQNSGLSERYKKQFMLYMYLMGYKAGVFLIENKDNQDFYEKDCRLDMEFIKSILDTSAKMKFFVGNDKLPPLALDFNDDDCGNCPYDSECKR